MENLDDLWDSLLTAKKSLLIFDYEGTLTLPHSGTKVPEPYPWVKEMIESILSSGSKVGIISNHSVDELTQVLRFAWEIEIWGLHGTEMRRHEETMQRFMLPTDIKAGFKHAIDRIKIAGWHRHVVRKHGLLSISWASVSSREADQMRVTVPKLLEVVLKNEDFILIEYPDKYELRTIYFDKSTSVASMILDADRDAVIAYIGDDGAFRMLNGTGYSFLVNTNLLRSPARNRLTSTEQLTSFLAKWHSITKGSF